MATTMTLLNYGALAQATLILNNGFALSDLTMRLYNNNHTPVVTDTPAAYTECPAGTGYVAVVLVGSGWTVSAAGGVATATRSAVLFSFTAPPPGLPTIYGVYYTDSTGRVLAAALMDTPFTVPAAGGSMTIDPTWANQQCS